MRENLNYIFYKGYYNSLLKIEEERYEKLLSKKQNSNLNRLSCEIEKENNKILNLKKSICCKKDMSIIPDELSDKLKLTTFDLMIGYPGLMTGIGIMHQIGVKAEFKSGFSLDYTTGMPYIPASSVKGVLHSVFRGERWVYIAEKMGWKDTPKEKVNELERLIFGVDAEKKELVQEGQDIFFDAVIIDCRRNDGRILGQESITPHEKKTKNPNPIAMLKILPNNIIRFSFQLQNSMMKDRELVTIERKQRLFREILKDFGIGAKTNVGFGALNEIKDEKVLLKKSNKE